MTYVSKLLKIVYNALNQDLHCSVFTNVPDNAYPPYVRIGEFTVQDWLLAPLSSAVSMTVSAFSDKPSSMEVIELEKSIRTILLNHTRHHNLSGEDASSSNNPGFIVRCSVPCSNIFQLQNRTWVAEVQLKFNIIREV